MSVTFNVEGNILVMIKWCKRFKISILTMDMECLIMILRTFKQTSIPHLKTVSSSILYWGHKLFTWPAQHSIYICSRIILVQKTSVSILYISWFPLNNTCVEWEFISFVLAEHLSPGWNIVPRSEVTQFLTSSIWNICFTC